MSVGYIDIYTRNVCGLTFCTGVKKDEIFFCRIHPVLFTSYYKLTNVYRQAQARGFDYPQAVNTLLKRKMKCVFT